MPRRALAMLVALLCGPAMCRAQRGDELPERAAEAMRRATDYLVHNVAVQGGYPCAFDPATGQRWGETELAATQLAVIPPGTPTVGLALLRAHQVTGEALYLDAALAAARALLPGQLASGGWAAVVDLGGDVSYTRALRLAGEPQRGRRNETRLDQGITTEPLRLLLRVAAATGDVELQAAADDGVRALLQGQLGNGGWPAALPLPDDDRRLATIGDGVTPGVTELLLEAGQREAALRGGGLLLRARLGGDHPVWPTRLDLALAPVPATADVAGTARVAECLLKLFEATGDQRWLEPLPQVADWLDTHVDGDGRSPRQVDLATGKPLGEPAELDVAATVSRVRDVVRWPKLPRREPTVEQRARTSAARAPQVAAILAALDDQGRWLDDGRLSLRTAVDHLAFLTQYLAEYQPPDDRLLPAEDLRPPQHRR